MLLWGVIFAINVALLVAGVLVTIRLYRRLRNRPALAVLGIALVVLLFGWPLLGVARGMLKAIAATTVDFIDKTLPARLLAEGISEAMNCTVLGLILLVPTVCAGFILRRKSRQPEGAG